MPTITFRPDFAPEHYVLDVIYQVRTVEEALRTKKDIERFGTPTTGFAQYDSQLVGSYTTCAINIGRMAEIHENGFYIGLVDSEDAANIYLSVEYYLDCWKKVLDSAINVPKVPYELLYRLDRFAHLVYPSAQPHFLKNVPETDGLSLFIENFNRSSDIGALEEIPVLEEGQAPEAQQRRSLQEDLMNHQARWLK